MDFGKTWYILCPSENLKPYWFSMSKVKVTRSNLLPRNILVNTLVSTSFNGFWPNLVHTLQSGTLLIFKVIGQRSRSEGLIFTLWTLESTSFNGFWSNLVNTYVLQRIWNPIDFQGQKVKVTGSNFLLWTLQSISVNGFW